MSPKSQFVLYEQGTLGLRPRKSGVWCRNQRGVNDRALLHRQAVGLEMGFDRLKDQLAEIVLLEQMAEAEDRGFIRDTHADQDDPREATHRRNLNQCILHRWIAEVVPLLHQVNPQNGLQ